MSFPGGGTANPLALLADLVWDQPEAGALVLRAGTRARSATVSERYLAVPSRARPRYLLPLDASPAAQKRLLTSYNRLRSPKRRAARRVVAEAAARRLMPAGPRRLVEVSSDSPPSGSLLALAGEHLGCPAGELVMAIGVNDKGGLVRPTLTVADLGGTPRLFLKIARHRALRARLSDEYAALTAMSEHPADGILTPAPVLLRDWEGRSVLGVAPLPLEARGVHFRQQPQARAFLERLHASRPAEHQLLGESDWLQATSARITRLGPPYNDGLAELLEDFRCVHGETRVAVGIRHGDWSPWNMAHLSGARIAVWDWEFSQTRAPLSLDRLNWEFAYATSVRKTPAADAARTLLAAHPGDVGEVRMFLLDMAVRRAEEASCGLASSAEAARAIQELVRSTGVTAPP